MKSKKYNFIVLVIAFVTLAYGCSDMESIHEEYLQGERIYAGALDSLKVESGYNRLKITGLTHYIAKSDECTVEWDDTSAVYSIENIQNGVFEMIVEGLDERSYEFNVHTADVEGNESVHQTVRGRAIGDVFVDAQFPRRITGYEYTNGSVMMKWADKTESEYVLYSNMKYENKDGGYTSEVVMASDSVTAIANWVTGGDIFIESMVQSGYNGFDTIALDPALDSFPLDLYFQLDKSEHALMNMPSDNPGTAYGAKPSEFLFDGNGEYNGDVQGYHSGENAIPHHLTIDLGVLASLRKFRVDLRTDGWKGNNPTAIELWGIDDITNAETSPPDYATFISKGWKLLYSETGISNALSFKEIEIPGGGPQVRYVRYRVTNSTGKAAQATEMTFWCDNIVSVN
ncbi:DUF4998 domain-containing protein [Carboxylicivirga marina]|uniref:DUF5000 domain-containing protein n=1 Tax=Carboxylicivirga marina TaxID=2800988 RepID=A0ABS1HPL2_9BACT|nr:DUF4998 domain-containing protein [Carboxylicivirga marina]MBK3519163.1 hypothetical protein [Carboxylicivirga marina]